MAIAAPTTNQSEAVGRTREAVRSFKEAINGYDRAVGI